MPHLSNIVVEHYEQPNLSDDILSALRRSGADLTSFDLDDLAPFDEFHIRGRKATRELIERAGLGAGDRVLDVGCGVGGPARRLAAEAGCHVVGLDVVESFCRAAEMLTRMVGLLLGIQLFLGPNSPAKARNVLRNLEEDRIRVILGVLERSS